MTDEVTLNKVAVIERCVARAREEYARAGASFAEDYTRQDAAILNLQRACEAALDLALHRVRSAGLGLPRTAREAYALLAEAALIDRDLATSLQRMVGFRNLAVHDYQNLQLEIVEAVLRDRLPDLLTFARLMLQAPAP